MSEAKILVVEDEPSIREVVSLYLKRAGYQVTVVSDGQAALEVLSGQSPDLVVLDLMLPEVDGLEITRWLRERGDTPIIMLTARREERDRNLLRPVRYCRRNAPVCERRLRATFSGVPIATTSPPSAPPSGPRSITQSAVLTTSMLCSTTRMVFPCSVSFCSESKSVRTSS